jgi:tRNA (guanine37-N1)-methyltransferase
MKIDILTLFPEMFDGPFDTSMIKKAKDKKLIEIKVHNLRKWSRDKHKTVDDRPYGGGPGMIIRVDIIDRAVSDLKSSPNRNNCKVILLSAKGDRYDQKKAQELSELDHSILISGHYEGIDHRVHEHISDEVLSIGDYVLTGGEIPAMVVVDSVVRLIPGVLKPESLKEESFSQKKEDTKTNTKKVEYPQYTRPENYKGWRVPEVLLSGNHKEIEKWRREKRITPNN